ncbi:MAG: D-alanine--D-alanine ligase [Candidatus Omnitrophica bacterium]|nr:D-alanine--D-alanine ligase [Candidatus Omnitrophota bacterium]
MRVAVLLGGRSSERDVSIKSGTAVFEALKGAGVDAVCIDVSDDPVKQIRDEKADVAFIALHGKFGEDGTLQAMLDRENIPYTGSGPKASRLAMDKLASRQIFEKSGVPVPKYIVMKMGAAPYFSDLSFPVVVKPNKEGSSIGLTIVSDKKDLDKALKQAFLYDDDVLVEQLIEGEDLTVGILDDNALPVIHIKPKSGIYDYKSKYTQGMTEYVVPADINETNAREAQRLGLLAHKLLGCRCFSRVDIMLSKRGAMKVLEVNTIPGLTATSLLPKAAKAAGIDFARMCLIMIESVRVKVSHG